MPRTPCPVYLSTYAHVRAGAEIDVKPVGVGRDTYALTFGDHIDTPLNVCVTLADLARTRDVIDAFLRASERRAAA